MVGNVSEISKIKAELARYPQLNDIPKTDNEILTLGIDFNRGVQEFPSLFKLVNQAYKDANAASLLDQHIPTPLQIVVTNDPVIVKEGARLEADTEGNTYVTLPKNFFDVITHEDALAVLTHEFGHINQANDVIFLNSLAKLDTKHVLGPESWNVPKRIYEITNDRLAADEVAFIDYFLSDVSKHAKHYQYSEIDHDHPNVRNRVEALLREAYADKGLSGKFQADNQFHLKTQDFLPITEDGRKVTNYFAEVLPAMEKQVAKDLKALDQLVAGGLTNSERLLFIDHLRHSIADFREQHPLKLEAPSNVFMAQQFEASLKDPRKLEAVMAMHEKMPLAFKAYDQAVQQSKHFTTPEAQDLIINTARQHIVDGISKGKYPETTESLKQTESVAEYVSIPVANAIEMGH